MIQYSFHRKLGVWWFRIFGVGLILRAPWDQALFSERYGYRKYLRAFGWRVGFLGRRR